MKTAKKVLSVLLAGAMTASLAVAFTGCNNNGEGGESGGSGSKTIYVVAKGESHAFWQSVKSGAEAAAKDRGYTINFRGPASESAKDLPSQLEMATTAVSQALPVS